MLYIDIFIKLLFKLETALQDLWRILLYKNKKQNYQKSLYDPQEPGSKELCEVFDTAPLALCDDTSDLTRLAI